MTSSQPLPNQLAKIKVRKKTAQKHHPPFKMFKISANTAPLVGVGWGTYSYPRVHSYMGFFWSTCICSDRTTLRCHWLSLCRPQYHWPAFHCKTIQDRFALLPGSLHTFRLWFCLQFYEAFCFHPETDHWNHIKHNNTVSRHYQALARENEERQRSLTHVTSLARDHLLRVCWDVWPTSFLVCIRKSSPGSTISPE